jgi:hypothetical protein
MPVKVSHLLRDYWRFSSSENDLFGPIASIQRCPLLVRYAPANCRGSGRLWSAAFLLPGAVLVPSVVAFIAELQWAGYSYAKAS